MVRVYRLSLPFYYYTIRYGFCQGNRRKKNDRSGHFSILCPTRTAMENAPSGQKVEKRLKAFFKIYVPTRDGAQRGSIAAPL